MNAFLLLQAIETVALRIERHVENGGNVPRFLRNHSPGAFTRVLESYIWISHTRRSLRRERGCRRCSLSRCGMAGQRMVNAREEYSF